MAATTEKEPIQDWNKGDKSGLVSIGTHKLYLSTSGLNRKPGEPLAVLMQGLGAPLVEWNIVRRNVTPFTRWLQYDRSGLGQSESAPDDPEVHTATSVAVELDLLLKNAGIEPPFVIVAHSWGGITSREFLHLRPKDVVGIIFVDANQENHFYYRKEPLPEVGVHSDPYEEVISGKLDYLEYGGLAREQKLSKEEWAQELAERATERHCATIVAEFKSWKNDGPVLAAKKQFETKPLGDYPVSVLRADSRMEHERMYAAGVEKGNGTEEERAQYRELIRTWDERDIPTQKEMLKLSTFGRFRTVEGSLHCIQMTHPEAIVEEVRWMLDHLAQK